MWVIVVWRELTCLGCAAPPPSRHCSDSLAALSIDGGGGGVEWGGWLLPGTAECTRPLPAAPTWVGWCATQAGECHTKHGAALEGPQSPINRSHPLKPQYCLRCVCMSGWLPVFTCQLGRHVKLEATQVFWCEVKREFSHAKHISSSHSSSNFCKFLPNPVCCEAYWNGNYQICREDVKMEHSTISHSRVFPVILVNFPCWKEPINFSMA